ncbi:MAG: DNA internalization-related competence protein ComEC/Rec2, partial [Candidatus Marinimicrobia bacterium]|nr:DNA internalization-related competence protein ComEC/Rec2 [Candidatus Neomarinimicrobiota bacterium]
LFTPGFQLSFSAVAGILYLYPRLKERLLATELGQRATGNSFGRGVVDLLLISFTAQAGVLPAQAYWFYSLPLYGLIANMVVVPLAGLVVMGGALGLVAMSVWSWLGEIFLNTCWAGISAIQWAATSVAQWPYASITTGRPNLLEGLAIVTAIVFLPEIGSWVTRRLLPRLTMLLLGIGIVAVWTPALGSRELEVTMLDVGQGDAIHLRLPAGQNILVDCGPRTRTFDAGRSIIRPYLHAQGITALEGVVVSHPHLDHYGGLSSLLDDFHIRSVWQPVQRSYYASYASVIDKAGKRGSDISVLRAGEALSFGAVDLLVLSPDSMHAVNASNDNDASLILKLEFGETSMLFMGDGEFEIERHLLVYDSLLTSDWLKIGHHGAVTASSKAFLRQVNPRGALISVGKYNRYGHPADETLARLHEHGLQVLRTDMDGAIRLNSDGRGWQVTQWR